MGEGHKAAWWMAQGSALEVFYILIWIDGYVTIFEL